MRGASSQSPLEPTSQAVPGESERKSPDGGDSPVHGGGGAIGQKRPPAAAPPPSASFKPASGRPGAEESPSPPPPSSPLPWQSSTSVAVTARARARTDPHPGGSHNRTHTHTHTYQQTKGLDTPVPSRPPGQRGRGIPSPAPPQGKLGAASCGGEGDPVPWWEGARTVGGSPAPQESRTPTPTVCPLGLRPGQQHGGVGRESEMSGIPGSARGSLPGSGDWSCPASAKQRSPSLSFQNRG